MDKFRVNVKMFFAAAAAFAVTATAYGNGLTEKQYDLGLDFSYTDTEDDGDQTDLAASWLYIVMDGHLEVGGAISYFQIDPDIGESVDATAIGPVVQYNFTPDKDATFSVLGSAVAVGGDLGDFYDFGLQAGAGVRVFAGDSAALDIGVLFNRLIGDGNVDDRDSFSVVAGFSIFVGGK